MSHAEMNTKFEAPKKEFHKKPSHHSGQSKSSAPNKAGNHWANKTNKTGGGGNTSNPSSGTAGAPKKHHSGGGKSWGPKKPSGGNNFSY
jgi:hypothetical protein